MANLITLSRLLLLIVVAALAYRPPDELHFLAVFLLVVMFVTDSLDGWVARRRHEESLFGALFDIAGDRIVEMTMWIVLADLELVPIWVPLVFVVRGTIVDTIRSGQAARRHEAPFAVLQTTWARFIVASRFMRTLYAVVKAHAFGWLLLIQPLPKLAPELWARWGGGLTMIGDVLVWLSVALCVLRGLPPVLEFARAEREAILGSLGRIKGLGR
jgi:CDP-diacylglycerol--glycerol-3-phosphate 3-phosphatidyltransferase